MLGDIPVLGWFFKNSSSDKQRKETIIFLTPHLIEGDEGIFATNIIGKKKKVFKTGSKDKNKPKKPEKK